MEDFLKSLDGLLSKTAELIIVLTPIVLAFYKKIAPIVRKMRAQANLINKAQNDLLIKEELERMLERTYADRCYTFLFHNGIKGVDNVGWYYMDCKHEVLREDVSPMVGTLQNIPCSNCPEFLQKIMKNERVEIPNTENENFKKKNKQLYQLVKSQNVKAMLCIPLNKKGEIIGYVGIDYTVESNIYKTIGENGQEKFRDDLIMTVMESIGIIKKLL